jgi:cytochrome c553
MKRIAFVVLALCGFAGIAVAAVNDPPPPWAFPVNPNGETPDTVNPNKIERIPGSSVTYTHAQTNSDYLSLDWFPKEHPALPPIVAFGHEAKKIWACSLCHGAVGEGGSESAALTGLPAGYIIQQVEEFRSGRRKAAEAKMDPPHGMEDEAKNVSDADVKAAAAYFSQLTFKSHVQVIEADVAPKATPQSVGVMAKAPGGGTEPLGRRIVEIPDDIRNWGMSNPHMQYLAYVPKGSIRRGAALVTSGDGAAPCATCHGLALRGTSVAPPLAGRSPSYIVRQLYDIQYGTRRGPAVALMQPEVAHMTADDRIAIAAYVASLKP